MSINIILTSDVPGLGQMGESHQVKPGYARNYLLPKRLAVLATADGLKRIEKQKEKIAGARAKQLESSKGTGEKLSKVGLVFERTLGPGGRLYGSVTPNDITLELAKNGVVVDKKSILMHSALKSTGDHMVRVRIHSQVVVDVPVKIIGKEANKTEHHAMVETAEPETPFGVEEDY